MINKLVIIILLLGYFVTGVYAGEVTVSSGTSVDLTAHRRPYTTVLKMGQQDFNVAGSAIVSGWALTGRDKPPIAVAISYALVFYHDGTWSTGATNRVDSIGGGKYFLPKGKNPKDILGVGSSGIGGYNRRGFVFVWFNDGTACRGRFPYHKELYKDGKDVSEDKIYKYYLKRYGTIYCGVSGKEGIHYGYSVAYGKQPKDVVAVAIDSSNNMVFAYYRDGTVSAGTSDDLDSKRPATEYRLPGDKSPQDIIDIGIDGYNHHVYAFYRTEAKKDLKRFKNFKLKTPK